MLIFLVCMSCAPETLKIHIPPTGIDSVNQEDLRRAYWALESGTDPILWWSKRAVQFHLQPLTNECYGYEGLSDDKGTVYAQLSPMQLTVMASMAKSLDGTEASRSWSFCLSENPPQDESDKVIDLTDDWGESPPFVTVNFTRLARTVELKIQEYRLLE